MAYPREEDPLLPKGSRAPEIQVSQPVSISDDVYLVPSPPQLEEDQQPREKTFGDFMALVIGLCIALSLIFILLPAHFFDGLLPFLTPKTIEQRVNDILTDTPLIDGHNDLAIMIRYTYDNRIYDKNFTEPFEKGWMHQHVDIPRLRKGKTGGAFWSAFVPCPANGTDFSDENYAKSVAYTLSQIDLLRRIQEEYPETFSPPTLNSSTALAHFKSGRLISPLAIEGLHQIGNSLSTLRNYYSLGVRYATLTHNCHNAFADAALVELPGGGVEVAKPLWGGLSPAGRTLLYEMNRLGMIVDLAHVSRDTMYAVLNGTNGDEHWGSAAPVIFSHSSAYAICPHPRSVPDDVLLLVKERRSLVMVNFSPDFISCTADKSNPSGLPIFDPQHSTIGQVVRHIMHIGSLIGYEHVGIGSDFDGIPNTPRGLEDVSKFPDLVAELLVRGVSDDDVRKVVGGNLLRVWRDVDRVSLALKAWIMPVEDKLPSLRGEMEIETSRWKDPFHEVDGWDWW